MCSVSGCAEARMMAAGFHRVEFQNQTRTRDPRSEMTRVIFSGYLCVAEKINIPLLANSLLEQALIDTPTREGKQEPVAMQHVVRSFEPCTVCTVH